MRNSVKDCFLCRCGQVQGEPETPQQTEWGINTLTPHLLLPTTACEHVQWPDPACSLRSLEPTVAREDQPSLAQKKGGIDGTRGANSVLPAPPVQWDRF